MGMATKQYTAVSESSGSADILFGRLKNCLLVFFRVEMLF